MMKLLFLALLLPAGLAHAQSEDEAIPYSDDEAQDERNRRELPQKSESSGERREETQVESEEREESLAAIDDPSIGLSGELIFGAMLLDSSRGAMFETRPMAGLRFTWEWARTVFTTELARELSFVDVSWSHASTADGTTQINATSNYHYLTFAPAFAWPFGSKPVAAVFVQAGIGVAVNPSQVEISGKPVYQTGSKLLLQYGGGLRFRPLVVTWGRRSNLNADFAGADDGMRISFRLELTRFRRGYADDTFLGSSLGVTF